MSDLIAWLMQNPVMHGAMLAGGLILLLVAGMLIVIGYQPWHIQVEEGSLDLPNDARPDIAEVDEYHPEEDEPSNRPVRVVLRMELGRK